MVTTEFYTISINFMLLPKHLATNSLFIKLVNLDIDDS